MPPNIMISGFLAMCIRSLRCVPMLRTCLPDSRVHPFTSWCL